MYYLISIDILVLVLFSWANVCLLEVVSTPLRKGHQKLAPSTPPSPHNHTIHTLTPSKYQIWKCQIGKYQIWKYSIENTCNYPLTPSKLRTISPSQNTLHEIGKHTWSQPRLHHFTMLQYCSWGDPDHRIRVTNTVAAFWTCNGDTDVIFTKT